VRQQLLSALRRRAGRAEQLAEESFGGVVGLDVQLGEPALEPAVGAAHGVGTAEARLQPHDPLVQLLVVGVPAGGGLQGGERAVTVAGALPELGEAAGGVGGLAAQLLAGGFGPVVVGAFEEAAVVGGGGALERRCLGGVTGCRAGGGEGGVEAPDVAVDEVGGDAPALAGPLDDGGAVEPGGRPQGVAQARMLPAVIARRSWPTWRWNSSGAGGDQLRSRVS